MQGVCSIFLSDRGQLLALPSLFEARDEFATNYFKFLPLCYDGSTEYCESRRSTTFFDKVGSKPKFHHPLGWPPSHNINK